MFPNLFPPYSGVNDNIQITFVGNLILGRVEIFQKCILQVSGFDKQVSDKFLPLRKLEALAYNSL